MSGRSRGRRGGGQRPAAVTAAEARRQLEQSGDGYIRGREIDAGDLSGEIVEPIKASFTYFGKRFRVNPDLTETMVIDLLESGEDIEDPEDPRQLIAVKAFVRDHLHRDDFDEFWETAVDNRQGVKQVVKLCWTLLERITDRPTTPPSDSSDGRRDMPTSSRDGVSGPVIESTAVEDGPPSSGNVREVADHFIRKFEEQGRPDKALQIALALEAREARGLVTV